MNKLRKEKLRLEARIAIEKVELYQIAEDYTKSLWPVKVLNRFRKTAESLSESKLLVIGAQLAFAALNTVKSRNSGEEEEGNGGIKNFLKTMVNNFLQQYMNKDEE
ncbi:MAG: hypothetical protein M3R17_05025 [Bacteroidota bacterium]|nr:hypothetical protein [Bacteroidota bacterium]